MSSNNCTKTVTKSCTIGTSGLNCTITATTKCDVENKNCRTPRTNDFFSPSLGGIDSTHHSISSFRESLSGSFTLRENTPSLGTDVYQGWLELKKLNEDIMREFGPKW